jgi:hypothetical protein
MDEVDTKAGCETPSRATAMYVDDRVMPLVAAPRAVTSARVGSRARQTTSLVSLAALVVILILGSAAVLSRAGNSSPSAPPKTAESRVAADPTNAPSAASPARPGATASFLDGTSGPAGQSPVVSAATPVQLVEVDHLSLPGPVYDLAYDQPRNALWFAFMRSGSAAALFRYDIATRTLSSTALPPTTHNGFLERVVVAPDGSIWVTEEYSVVRLDPDTSKTESLTFSQGDVDATPTALSPSDGSPGTWPAAITFDSTGAAVISRHNVTSLIRVAAGLTQAGRIRLPNGMAGPGDLAVSGGLFYAVPYVAAGATEIFSSDGTSVATASVGAIRLTVSDGVVISVGPSGVAELSATGSITQLLPAPGDVGDLIAPSTNGVFAYSAGLATLDDVSLESGIVAVHAFSVQTVKVAGPGGSPLLSYATDEITALASNGDKSVWYVDSTNSTLVHLEG